MKSASLVLVIVSFFVMLQAPAQAASLKTVDSVDLKRYLGTWFEIARLPNSFQKKCVSDVSANYSMMEDNRIKVVNRCKKKNGEFSQSEGVAKLANSDGTNSKLKVRFAPAFLSFLGFVWGDYWIIELASDYSYAVVGEPSLEYLWILSRTPKLDRNVTMQLLENAKKQGYDISKIEMTKQE